MKTPDRTRRPATAGGLRCSMLARRALRIFAVLCALGAPWAELQAQSNQVDLTQLSLEQLLNLDVPSVYGASKLEQKTTEAPSSVTIITADEIKKYGYRTLADVLGSVQGFYTSYDRNYSFLGARGISLGDFNDRVLVLVDGHRVNNDFNDGAFIDTAFLLDMDLVDRVEIIRGPGSVLYGNNAFFGVINVITRQGRQLRGFEVSSEYGSFDTYKTRVTYGELFTNGVQMLLSGTYYDSGGQDRLFYKEFDTPAQNYGVAQNLDGDSSGSFFGSLGYADFTLEGAFNQRVKENPTAQYLTTFNDPRLRTIDEQSYTGLKYAHSFPDVVDVTAQVYFDDYTHDIGYPQLTNSTSSRLSTEKDLGEWWGAELQLNKRLWDRHVLTLGAEYRDDFLQDSRVVVEGMPDQGSDTRSSRQSYGVYAQGDFALLTNLHFNGGVRYDQYDDFSPSWDPRLALVYHPWERSTFKAIYGTAFRAPSFYELALSDQALKPEEITSYELVYEQGFGPHLRSSLSGFYNQMDDLLVFNSGSFTNFNADTRGVELALEGLWAGGIRGRASYSLQETKNSSVGWEMPDSPNQLLKFNLSAPLVRDKVFAGMEFQYTSNRRSLQNTTGPGNQPLTVQGEDAGDFGIVNLTLLAQKLVKNLEFSASVYNVLDRRYDDPASQFHVQDIIEQDGRSFRLKLTYHF
jgi:iron complex outermembrane receptor protein